MLYALLIVPILTFLIFIHELGHYVTAKRAGMKVEEFGFGLPPRLFGIQRGETIWSINLIPVGGFVRVLGEDGKNFDPRSMQAKTAGQRALFMAAGSLMNFLAALVLIGVLLGVQGEPLANVYVTGVADDTPAENNGWQAGDQIVRVAGRDVESAAQVVDATNSNLGEELEFTFLRNGEFVESTVVPREDPPPNQGPTGIQLSETLESEIDVQSVEAGSIAAQAGLQDGDEIEAIDGHPITDSYILSFLLEEHAGETVSLDVMRDGELTPVDVRIPESITDEPEALGASFVGDIQFERPSPLMVVPLAIEEFFNFLRLMGEGLMMLIRGEIPLSEVAGPIGMGQLTSEIVEQSTFPLWTTILNITIVLSLNLAILNLLPLPALDGGRLLFVLIEVLRRGKRVAPEKEGVVHFVGLVLLLTFMVAVAFVDIGRIVSGDSLLQ